MIHHLEADLDSFGNILQPKGVEDLVSSLQCDWLARAVVSGLNQQKAAKFREDAVIGKFFATENVYDTHHFFDMGLSKGFDCWHDEQFIREASRDMPETRIRSKPRNVSIIVPANKYTRIEPRPQVTTEVVAKAPVTTRIVVKTPSYA